MWALLLVLLFCAASWAQQVTSPLCQQQNLCTCWTNTTATQPPACYSLAIYNCPGGNRLVSGPEPTQACSIPRASASPSPSPQPPTQVTPSPSPAPRASPSPTPAILLPPATVCQQQNLCTCWSNTTATQPPACYSLTIYRCPTGTQLLAGPEPSGQCSIPRTPLPSPSPQPAAPSPSPSPAPRASPSPSPAPRPSPSPSPPTTTLRPAQVCEDQNLCTCWSNTTATQPPACYSLTIYRCPTGTQLLAGPEPSGQCSISRTPLPSPSPQPAAPSPSPSPTPRPSPSPSPAPRPSPSPSPIPPSPSPSPLPPPSPSPSPTTSPSPSPSPPVTVLLPARVCEDQNLCTCWSNTTATQPPACYSLTIYRCPTGMQLLAGPEPSGQCSIPRTPVPSPSPQPPPTAPSPSPSPAPPSSPAPTPSPAPPQPQPNSTAMCNAPDSVMGTLVAPVAGTLAAARDTPPPFARFDNMKTTRLIRMPAASQDVNGLLSRPVPTSAWWTNIMWGGPSNTPTYGEDAVQLFPYHIRVRGPPSPSTAAVDRGLWFCKPFYTGDNDGGVIMATWPELQLTLQEIQSAPAPAVTAANWDALTLTLDYTSDSSNPQSPRLRLPLVRGSPYITAQVPSPAQPVLRGPGNGGGTINSVTQTAPNKLRVLVGGVPGGEGTHTFLLWGSTPISYTLSAGSIRISATDPSLGGKFSGYLRTAWVPNAGAAGAAKIEAMLDTYVDAVPVGGSVKAWSNTAVGTASYSMSWSTQSMTGAATPLSQLLMLALPHHVDTMAVASDASSPGGPSTDLTSAFPLGTAPAGTGSAAGLGSNGVYTSTPAQGSARAAADYGAYIMTVRGPQVPVVGSCWLLQEQAVPLVTETQAAANLRDPAWRAEIEQSLLADLPLVLPPSSGNPFAAWPGGWPWKGIMNLDVYFGGSEMEAMARLIHIAKALEETSAAAGSSFGLTAASAAANVTNALGMLLQRKLTLPCSPDGANPGALCYDGVFKMVTTARALTNADDGMDFFSRTGTDHHFHFGYSVAAAAAVASQNLPWYKAYLEPAVRALIRDFANNDNTDTMFPFARHKDWYMGHSWAAGLQISADGKNQESSSEAVNAYLSVVELGKVTGDAALEGWGQVLLASEVTAARKYTQAYTGNDIYRQVAGGSSNNGVTKAKVATILFAAKASTFNWFDPDMLTRHAIQWMPFTPASTALLPSAWLQESVPLVQAQTKMPTNRYWSWGDQGGGAVLGWRVLLAMAQSMIPGQQAAAWDALKALPLDASEGFALCGTIGRLTRTAAKWWIATRP